MSQTADSAPAGTSAAPASPSTRFIEAGELKRFLKLRKKVEFSDKVTASLGMDYDIDANKWAPAGTVTWQPQPHLRFQLTEQVALARREWPLKIKSVTATVKAEAAYWLQQRRPELSIGLSDLQPRAAMLAAVGAIFLLRIPVTLKDQEARVKLIPPYNSLQAITTLRKHKGQWLGLQLNVQQLAWMVEF